MRTRFLLGLILTAILVFSTNQAIAQWSPVPQMQWIRVSGILAINDTIIFIGGFNGAFIRSTDGGKTWSNVYPAGMGTDSIFTLEMCGSYVFAGTNAPISLYSSSDSGSTWTASGQSLPANTNVNGMTYLSGVTYAATTNGVLSSTDHGTSWTVDSTGLHLGAPLTEYMNYGTVGITVAGSKLYVIEALNGSGVYSTNADNIDWMSKGLDTLSEFAITSMDTNVLVATDRGVFLYGGGTNWIDRSSGLPFADTAAITLCTFAPPIDSLLFIYVEWSSSKSWGREIYVTSDLGLTWKQVNDSLLSGSSVTAMVTTPKYLFAGTTSGAWRIPISDVITSVKDDHPQMPVEYSLSQNYPNPFNPSTIIGYQLPANSHVTLKVYDVLGRDVQTLVDERQSAGSHTVTFNAARLASGVYFYQLTAAGVTIAKKMLIEK